MRNFGYFDARLRRFLFSQIQNWTRVWNWPFWNQFQPILNNLESKWVILKWGLFDSAFFSTAKFGPCWKRANFEPILTNFEQIGKQMSHFDIGFIRFCFFQLLNSTHVENEPILNQYWPILINFEQIGKQMSHLDAGRAMLKMSQYRTNSNQFWPILALIGYFDTRPIQFQCCQFKTNQLTLKIEQFWTNQNANRHLTRNPKRRRLKFFKLIRHRFSWTTDKENTSKLGTIYSNWLTFE